MKDFLKKMSERSYKKKPFEDPPLNFKKKKIFVFFTWVGLLHWFFVVILAVFALNYNNNLSIVLVCFLFGLYFVGLFKNFFLIKKFSLVSMQVDPVEENTQGKIVFRFDHKKLSVIPNVYLSGQGQDVPVIFGHETSASWPFTAPPWGLYRLPFFSFYSLWPYGLERTWVVFRPNSIVAVLPPRNPQQNSGQDLGLEEKWQEAALGDPDGIRPLAPSERGKIAWKDTLRRKKWMTYTYISEEGGVIKWVWPDDDTPAYEKIKKAKEVLDDCLDQHLSFQVIHPQFSSPPQRDRAAAFFIIERLMRIELSPQEWPNEK